MFKEKSLESANWTPRSVNFLAAVFFLSYLGYSLIFVSGTSSMTLRKDYWRHYDRIILPFQENIEGWKVLWTNHHHNPLLHIHQIVNEKVFAQNLIYDDWWMLALQASMVLVLIVLFLRRLDFRQIKQRDSALPPLTLLTIILTIYTIIAIQMGGREIGFYSAPLESFQNYSHALALLLIIFISRASRNVTKPNLIITVLLSALLLFSHFSYGIIYLTAIFVTWIAIAVRNKDKKIGVLAAAPLVGAIIYSVLLFTVILDPQKSSNDGEMVGRALALFPQIFETIWTFGEVTTKALFGRVFQTTTSLESFAIFANISIIMASLSIGLLGGRKFAIGTPLIIFGILFALATLVAREHSTILAPRISGNFEVMWAGCILNIGIYLVQSKDGKKTKRIGSGIMTLWLLATAFLLSIYSFKQIKLVESTKSQVASTELALFMTSLTENQLLDIVRPKNKDILEYLQQNELNVFSAAGKSRPAIQRHLEGQQICLNPTKNNSHILEKTRTISKITAVVPEPQCIVVDDSIGAKSLRIQTTATKYNVGALHVREWLHTNEAGQPFTKFTVAKGKQTFYVPLDSGAKIDICVRKPLKTVTITYCN